MFWGLIFLTIGIGGLAQQLGLVPAGIDLFWPIIFIGIGLSILFGKKDGGGWGCGDWFRDKKKKEK